MDSGSYAACAGLLARSQQLDLAAQDLANANSTGYRSQQTTFRSVLARKSVSSSWSDSVNAFGVLGDTRVLRRAGNLEATGNPLDMGIEGNGFFAVETPHGMQYTRSGQFRLAGDRALVTREGYPVTGAQGPIHLPEGALSISSDGTLSVDGALAGKIRVVEFPATSTLRAEGGSYYTAPPNAEQPAVSSAVRQGTLEGSNVDPVTSAVQLIDIERTAQMLQNALTTFHSNFDRVAAQDLAKV